MKKLLIVGVIGLFLGLACAPSINAEFQKYKYEDCNCNSGKDKFPIICKFLFLLYFPIHMISLISPLRILYFAIGFPILLIAFSLECSWTDIPTGQELIISKYIT